MLRIKIKKGDIIPIYTDYKENTGYEGQAILLERKPVFLVNGEYKDGDSFYINESLLPKEKKQYNKQEQLMIEKYQKLEMLFFGNKEEKIKPDKLCKRLYNLLFKQRSKKIDEYNKMYKKIESFRKKYKNESNKKLYMLFNEYTNEYLIRYMQQTTPNWSYSIFRSQIWKVKFIKDSTGWDISDENFITYRNIRYLSCNRPNDTATRGDYKLTGHTTYNGVPSDIYTMKKNHVDYTWEIKGMKKPKKEKKVEAEPGNF